MGGVELAPPDRRAALGSAGVRGGGRRGRAAAPARRRRRADAAAHDHVGGAAPHRARARATRSTRSTRRERVTWRRVGRRARPAAIRAARASGARRATVDRRRPRSSFASNDYLGLTAAPRGDRRRARRARPLGHGQRLGPPHRRLAPGALRARTRARGVEGACHAPRSSPPASRPTSACSRRSAAPGVLVCSDELNHASIIDGCRLARADVAVYRHRDLDHLARAPPRPRRRGARSSSPTPSSRWTATSPTVDALVELCAPRRRAARLDEAHAVLGPTLDARRRRRRAARRHAVEDARRARRFRRRPGALHRARREPRPPVHLHDRADARRHRRRARRARACCARPKATRSSRRLRAHVDRLRPGHPSPIVPFVSARSSATLDAAAALLDRGLLVPAIRPPTVAPGTSRLRVTLSAAHTDDQVDVARVAALDEIRAELAAPA